MVKLVKLSIVWCEMGTETGFHVRRFLEDRMHFSKNFIKPTCLGYILKLTG